MRSDDISSHSIIENRLRSEGGSSFLQYLKQLDFESFCS